MKICDVRRKIGVMMLVMFSCVFSTPLNKTHSCPPEAHSQYSQTSHLISHSSQRSSQHHLLESHANKHLDGTEHSDVVSRQKRSVRARGAVRKTDRRSREKKGGGASGCALRRVQMRVSDLGLGFKSQEEFMYTYCSGVCVNSLTNYDKIITSLTANQKPLLINSPPTACCRPIEYDDDLSFLDDNLIYHTMEKHSARTCGCV
ncbi:glial cell line-derived neurotrophic factor [Triplophysa rosa]|uniref:Glial cell line-derived neurotrophic factor-like n=1 Tax=Triplophysa rosa TaxID=992332 RepID=A0A9W7X2I7_TRIRA|nr:glial cell line-derived neurotrophic factor [Triplophysa rosa]XP_057181526.1 glial cell line-derived neurotrophic factor [Triplophysa rosa]XP_057181534.1 glial cell line-derived neurotrophic factor [Triplophysa rosa]KAI7812828.1 putative glial cell line-derived neurotrophic factor-like [Triplophysa rosa]